MDTRRFRNSPSQTLAQMRFLGWAMLMMFVLVQTAAGMAAPSGHAEDSAQGNSAFFQARAEFDPDTHLVAVKARAPVSAWDFTTDIGPQSFVVYENQVRQPVEDVQIEHTPLSIGVLLENGGRFHALNEAIAENVSRAANELRGAINPDDRLAMWTYGDQVQPLELWAASERGLQRSYLELPASGSSESNFYDALLATLPRLQEMPAPRVLFVLSSGLDSFSKASFTDVLRAAGDSGVPVCVINIGPLARSMLLPDSTDGQRPYGQLKWQQASAQLSRLSRASGCRVLTPTSALDFPTTYDALLANLRLQYVIRYRSTALDLPGIRHVRIAWLTGSGGKARPATGTAGLDREFARAQYELSPAAVVSSAGALDGWPSFGFAVNRVRIPLRVPEEPETQPSTLFATSLMSNPSAGEAFEQACRTSACTP